MRLTTMGTRTRKYPMNRAIPMKPCEKRTVQNCPWVPNEGSQGWGAGLGAPNPNSGEVAAPSTVIR